MSIRYFNRFELKYLISWEQHKQLAQELTDYMIPDLYGDSQGRYTNTSLYYDSAGYKAYWDKINGHKFRRKVRIRTYTKQAMTPDSLCFVEIKQRINKVVQKKRVQLPYSSAIALPKITITNLNDKDQAVVEEVNYLHHTLQLQPTCLVIYNRLAFNGNEHNPGLRVTFDTNLKGRIHHLSLLDQDYVENHFFLPPHCCVMEIKVNNRVPYWLTEFIARHNCTLRRVSKYCLSLEECKKLQNQLISER